MSNKNKQALKHPYRLPVALLILSLLAAYIFLPQLHSFQASLQSLREADLKYLLLAVGLFIASYFAATLSYCLITYFYIPYLPTLLVQVADGFTNRIFPGGLGAIATNSLYLIKHSKSVVKAGYVAVLNNILGFTGHMLILASLVIFGGQTTNSLIQIKTDINPVWLIAFLALCLIFIGLMFWRGFRRRTAKNYVSLAKAVQSSLKNPWRLIAGLLAAMMVTLFYASTLLAVMLALDVNLNFLQTFLVLTASVLAIAITPTPGGLGGAEASLIAAQVSFGVALAPALSVALTYRLITYWLPIIPGAIALRLANSKGYLAKPKL